MIYKCLKGFTLIKNPTEAQYYEHDPESKTMKEHNSFFIDRNANIDLTIVFFSKLLLVYISTDGAWGNKVTRGEYRTWTPCVDKVHQNMDQGHGPLLFLLPHVKRQWYG